MDEDVRLRAGWAGGVGMPCCTRLVAGDFTPPDERVVEVVKGESGFRVSICGRIGCTIGWGDCGCSCEARFSEEPSVGGSDGYDIVGSPSPIDWERSPSGGSSVEDMAGVRQTDDRGRASRVKQGEAGRQSQQREGSAAGNGAADRQ